MYLVISFNYVSYKYQAVKALIMLLMAVYIFAIVIYQIHLSFSELILEEKKTINLEIGPEQISFGVLTLLPLSQETTSVLLFSC